MGARLRTLVVVLVAIAIAAALITRPSCQRPAPGPAPPHAAGAPGMTMPDGPAPEAPATGLLAGEPIAGRVVTGPAGVEPAAGALVILASDTPRSALALERRAISDAKGGFAFGPQPPGAYVVMAFAPGHTAARTDLDTREPTLEPRPDQLLLRLGPCEDALHGLIADSSRGPIVGAQVLPADVEMTAGGVLSDDQGAFTLCLGRGPATVRVRASGYGSIAASVEVRGRTRRDFVLVPEASIAGRVVEDPGGAPVAGAQVRAESTEPGALRGATRGVQSDAEGRFTIDGLAPGRYAVTAGTDELAMPSPVDVLAQPTRTRTDVICHLRRGFRVAGTVVTGGADASRPVAGATVRLAGGAIRLPTAISDAEGRFAIAPVVRGEVTVAVELHEVVAPRRLAIDRSRGDVRIEVRPMGAARGRVTRAGRPVAGARVSARSSKATSDDDGRYALRGLPAGRYEVYASSDREGAFGHSAPVEISVGRTTEGVDIDLPWDSSIEGQVVDDKGAPMAGLRVRFTGLLDGDLGSDQTAADGAFAAAKLRGGQRYRAEVLAGALALPFVGGAAPAIEVRDGGDRVTGVRLVVAGRGRAISGRVVDGEGRPVPDAQVVALAHAAEEAERNQWGRFYAFSDGTVGISDADGAFRIEPLADGDYAVRARGPGGGEAELAGVRAGRRDVVLHLGGTAGIDGRLAGFHDTPEVVAARADRAHLRVHAEVDGDSFRLGGLGPGVWTVNALSAGQSAAARVELSEGQRATLTLTASGTGRLEGTIREWRTGAPVSDPFRCVVGLRAGAERTVAYPPGEAWSDAAGHFAFDAAPAGSVYVQCHRWGVMDYSNGYGRATVLDGAAGQVEVLVVKRQGGQPPLASMGAALDWQRILEAVLLRVTPRGPAATAGLQAGDQVVAVDGARCDDLGHSGVELLITDRPAGSRVPVTVTRGGRPIEAAIVLTDGG